MVDVRYLFDYDKWSKKSMSGVKFVIQIERTVNLNKKNKRPKYSKAM
jgi:hypothetical protein